MKSLVTKCIILVLFPVLFNSLLNAQSKNEPYTTYLKRLSKITAGVSDQPIVDIQVLENFMYVASSSFSKGTIKTYDVSNVYTPILTDSITQLNPDRDLYGLTLGHQKLLAYGENGITIYDISNPEKPIEGNTIKKLILNSNEYSVNTWCMEIVGNYLLAELGWTGMGIIDISDINAPILKDYVSHTGVAKEVKRINNSQVAFIDGYDLYLLNISNPTNLVKTTIAIPGDLEGLYIDTLKNLAYVTSYGSSSYKVYTVSLLSNSITGTFDISSYSKTSNKSITMKDSNLYIGSSSGILVLNATDPDQLLFLEHKELSESLVRGATGALTIYGNHIFARDYDDLYILGFVNETFNYPQNITSTKINESSFMVKWNHNAAAMGYKIDVAKDSLFNNLIYNKKNVYYDSTFLISKQTENSYFFRVYSYYKTNLSVASPKGVFVFSQGVDNQTVCDSLTWIDGITYTENNNTATFNLVNSSGIDSLVTLNLTILRSTANAISETACETFTLNSETYTSSGTYVQKLKNTAGCDSILTLHLTILDATNETDMQTACDSFKWIDGNTYTESNNTAMFVLANADGCDSVVTLNLTITNLDAAISQDNIVLTASPSGATYQWFDCINNNPVADATNQNFTPLISGQYAVIVEMENCIDTSECITVTIITSIEGNKPVALKIYPNPVDDFLIIEGVEKITTVEVYDVFGKKVLFLNSPYTEKPVIDMQVLEQGVYFIKIYSPSGLNITNVMKR